MIFDKNERRIKKLLADAVRIKELSLDLLEILEELQNK